MSAGKPVHRPERYSAQWWKLLELAVALLVAEAGLMASIFNGAELRGTFCCVVACIAIVPIANILWPDD